MAAPSTPTAPAADARSSFVKQRLHSLDAYRGLIMITLAFVGFGLAGTAKNHLEQYPDSARWQRVYHNFEHVEWTGCGYWDLIQPSFMFMVGVSMAYSYAKRKSLGHSWLRMFFHAVWRSLVLILLGIFLISNWDESTDWSLMNVLTQIGLGYWLLFLFWDRKVWLQAVGAAVILVGTWGLYEGYARYENAGIDLTTGNPAVGVDEDFAKNQLAGIRPAWHKNANVGHAFDLWLLNRFPRKERFEYNRGGYQTINFIPSLATMLFGLMCGGLLRNEWGPSRKLLILLAAGFGGLAAGYALHATGVCPLVKRIWTPSWALFSTGWCCLFLAGFYAVVDVLGLRILAFPLIVVGMNSIAIYCMEMLLKPWTARSLQTHFGPDVFQLKLQFGEKTFALVDPSHAAALALWEPTIRATMVGLVFWLICLWMYRQRFFVRI